MPMNDRDEQRRRWTETSPYRATVGGGSGERHASPSAERNQEPIIAVLTTLLPHRGRGLEVASGTGQHVVAFGRAFPDFSWTPSDPDPDSRRSIAAWIAHAGAANVDPPLALDVTAPGWSDRIAGDLDAVVAINLLHISPWDATLGLVAGAAALLGPNGRLIVYGPFQRGGAHTTPSNAEFDASLRHRNAAWGIRDLDAVVTAAVNAGLGLERVVDMPANNTIAAFTPAR